MITEKILELSFYTLPAIVTGGVSYYLFNLFINNEENRRRFLLKKDNQKEVLPLKLQAYERLTLFLERINPSKLLIRIAPISEKKEDYENLLIYNIEQEFEHNLAQQIYLSDEAWNIIITAKNTTIQMIRKSNMSDKIENSHKLREAILNDLLDTQSPSSIALSYLKNEIKEIL